MLEKEELSPLTELVEIYSSDKRGLLLQSLMKDYLQLKEESLNFKKNLKKLNTKITSVYVISLLTIVMVIVNVIGATTLQVSALGIVQLSLIFSLVKD